MATWDSSISYSALGSQPAPPKPHPPLSCQAPPPLKSANTPTSNAPFYAISPLYIVFFS